MKKIIYSILILALFLSTCTGINTVTAASTTFKTVKITSNYSVKIPNELKLVNTYSDGTKIDKNVIFYSNHDKINPYVIDAESNTHELAFFTSTNLKKKPKNMEDFILTVGKSQLPTGGGNDVNLSEIISSKQVKGGKVTVNTYMIPYSSGEGDGLIPREVMFFQTLKGDYIAVSFLCYGGNYRLSDKSSVIKSILSSIKYIPTKSSKK